MKNLFYIITLLLVLSCKNSEEKYHLKLEKEIETMADSFPLVLVEHGVFEMGTDEEHENRKPEHNISITKDFYIGTYEVTFNQYELKLKERPEQRVQL